MVVEESPLRDLARLIVWYPLRWMVSALPIARALSAMAILGKLHCRLSTGKRLILMDNLRALDAIGDQPSLMKETIDQFFETHYVSQLLAFLFPRLNMKNMAAIHEFAGLQKLDRVLANGKGCILLHAHFGPIHLPLFDLGLRNYDVKQIGYLRKPEGLSPIGVRVSFRMREQLERLIPAEIVQANRFLGSAFKHLKKNGILMMTGDGTGRGEFIGNFKPFSFLGQRMLLPVGPAKLANKTEAIVVPMFTIRQKAGHQYVTIIEDPLPSGLREADNMEITARFLQLFELYVKRYPGLWHFWDEFRKGQLLL
jgi:phosphatidylinositol dimannoside acyltransferase